MPETRGGYTRRPNDPRTITQGKSLLTEENLRRYDPGNLDKTIPVLSSIFSAVSGGNPFSTYQKSMDDQHAREVYKDWGKKLGGIMESKVSPEGIRESWSPSELREIGILRSHALGQFGGGGSNLGSLGGGRGGSTVKDYSTPEEERFEVSGQVWSKDRPVPLARRTKNTQVAGMMHTRDRWWKQPEKTRNAKIDMYNQYLKLAVNPDFLLFGEEDANINMSVIREVEAAVNAINTYTYLDDESPEAQDAYNRGASDLSQRLSVSHAEEAKAIAIEADKAEMQEQKAQLEEEESLREKLSQRPASSDRAWSPDMTGPEMARRQRGEDAMESYGPAMDWTKSILSAKGKGIARAAKAVGGGILGAAEGVGQFGSDLMDAASAGSVYRVPGTLNWTGAGQLKGTMTDRRNQEDFDNLVGTLSRPVKGLKTTPQPFSPISLAGESMRGLNPTPRKSGDADYASEDEINQQLALARAQGWGEAEVNLLRMQLTYGDAQR